MVRAVFKEKCTHVSQLGELRIEAVLAELPILQKCRSIRVQFRQQVVSAL